MALQTSCESGVLYVEVAGEFLLEEAEMTFVETIREAVRRQATKILIDGRTIEGEPEVIERFYFGEFAARTVLDYYFEKSSWRVPTFAFVLKEPTLHPKRFGETVMLNRGMQVKVFDKVEQARLWLGIAS